MKLSELKVDPDFRDCLPELSPDEYSQLEKNVKQYGIQSPLITWKGFIVDGHNRYDICFKNNITDVPVREEYFENKDDALQWILKNQLGRRNLSDFARNEIALRYKDIIAKRAKERQQAAGGDRKSENAKIGSGQMTTSDTDTGRARAEIAKIAGTNDSSVKRTEFILKNGTEEEIDRARQGGKGNSQGRLVSEIKKRITPEGMKICSRCFQTKPLEDFYRDRDAPDGRQTICKPCHDEENRISKEFGVSSEAAKLTEAEDLKPYTLEMFLNEIESNGSIYTGLLKNMISDRKNMLDDHAKAQVRSEITKIIAEIERIEDELL